MRWVSSLRMDNYRKLVRPTLHRPPRPNILWIGLSFLPQRLQRKATVLLDRFLVVVCALSFIPYSSSGNSNITIRGWRTGLVGYQATHKEGLFVRPYSYIILNTRMKENVSTGPPRPAVGEGVRSGKTDPGTNCLAWGPYPGPFQ